MIQSQNEEKSKEFRFEKTFNYKLIYVFRLPSEYKTHQGLLKIGDTTIDTDKKFDDKELQPNSSALNKAAKERIKEYSNTLGIKTELLYTEIAVYKSNKNEIIGFRDHDVHEVLENSGKKPNKFKDKTGKEWYKIDLETVKKAISAVKQGRKYLNPAEKTQNKNPIDFREEQQISIDKTINKFNVSNKMLWNAKMRFGKTLCALEVVKRMQFKRTLIITHRPVVDNQWEEDFDKIFFDKNNFIYRSRTSTQTIKDLLQEQRKNKEINFIYFASVQDLRGSVKVGGKFNKNEDLFLLDWDCVIIDEAHEGTTTELGENVKKELIKEKTKLLELSGTPFKIQENYEEDETYTWDYIDEQKAKLNWNKEHFGDYNPYSCLPKLNIYTYDLGKVLHSPAWVDIEDKSFNFKEFFRVWTGDKNKDRRQMPPNVKKGSFVYEKDIEKFLTLISKQNSETNYPYSKEEYRKLFKHSLWIVPGVKEAKALKELMQKNYIFGSTAFNIVNVAGEGDEDDGKMEDLQKVKSAIKKALENDSYTITLSCGKLTTGVTVPQWTAVLYLAGSYSTTPERYLQTIFRVQTPATINGKEKQNCYVFDFAPDRTLKILAKATHLSTKAGKTNTEGEEQRMGELLNFCPVLSISGTRMKEYNVPRLMEKLKDVYAERAVQNGFEDTKIYNEELFKLDKEDLKLFEDLKKIVGTTKPSSKIEDIDINAQGLTEEEREKLKQAKKTNKKELTKEQKELLEKQKQAKENRNKAISILRAISVRMPLLIYGADVNIDNEISIEDLLKPNIVDDNSWNEFMPTGVTKEIFKKFVKYYDKHIFILAGKKIRNIIKRADNLPILERIQEITRLFSYFKNPDKETVLTPWKVVNRHMVDCLGGYNFYDTKYESTIGTPLFVNQGQVTSETLANPNAKILEINSKTGLYPLFVTYSIFMAKCGNKTLSLEEQDKLWEQTIKENVFVICKTPMAKSITQRTLMGFKDMKINAHYFDDLIMQVEKKPEKFIKQILNPKTWNIEGEKNMKFDAIVGNPPYQEITAKKISLTNGQERRRSIFQYFQIIADELSSGITSLIYPGARWIHRSGKGMETFGLKQINDKTLEKIYFYPNSNDIFTNVAIADGISIVCKNKKKTSLGFKYIYHKNGKKIEVFIKNPGKELIPLNPADTSIIKKIDDFVSNNNLSYVDKRILPQKLFGIESSFVEEHPSDIREYKTNDSIDYNKEIKLFTNDKAGKAGRSKWYIVNKNSITVNQSYIYLWKVIVSSANAGGQKRDNQIEIVDNHSAFGRSRVALGAFKTKIEAQNFYNYANTNLIRFMFLMTDESLTSLGKKVPDIKDYTNNNKFIDFKKDLNSQLYKLFDLSKDEIEYLESRIKPME